MIRMFFGVPGCGKTTSAVREIYKLKRVPLKIELYNKFVDLTNKIFNKKVFDYIIPRQIYKNIYSNFECCLCKKVSLKDLGVWTFPPNSYISVDESSIEYNNRKFKSLPQYTIEWLKLHRHFECDLDFFSQSWDDTDITIRRLVDEIWYVRKLGPFTMLRRIYKKIEIDDNTHQIIDGYKFEKLLVSLFMKLFGISNIKIYLRKPYYKYFDSWSKPNLPIKYGVNTNETETKNA